MAAIPQAQGGVRGADVLVQTLKEAGVKTIYTLSGNHIMPIFDAAIGSGIELVHVRHEAAAVHMADAAARLTGRIGVAMVTGGPGHANAVSALYTALQCESPVILLSGHAPSNQLGKGAFQEMDQASVAAPCAKASILIQSRLTLKENLRYAIATATSGRPGPVAISLAQDALDGLAHDGLPAAASQLQTKNTAASNAAKNSTQNKAELLATIKEVARLIGSAKSPLILCGPQMLQPKHRSLLDDLENHSGVPVIGMESPRGMNDPALGAFASVAARADLVVLVGKQLDFTLKFADRSAFSEGVKFLVIDANEKALARAKALLGDRLILSAAHDAPTVIHGLSTAAFDSRNQQSAWFTEVKAAINRIPADAQNPGQKNLLHPTEVLAPFAKLAKEAHSKGREVILVSDGGEFGQWAQAMIRTRVRLINGPAGAIGAAIPMAIAAAHERPDALILAFMGDGAFGFHAAEFDTAVRCEKRFICVVGNDACWNAEYQIQLRSYGENRLIGCELLPLQYQKVAQAYGANGASCASIKELEKAVGEAISSEKAFCINAFISRTAAPALK